MLLQGIDLSEGLDIFFVHTLTYGCLLLLLMDHFLLLLRLLHLIVSFNYK